MKNCQKHHPPPTPPSKCRGTDGAVSRFNVDANRSPRSPQTKASATKLSPSLIGRPFAASPNSSSERSSTASAPKTPWLTFVAPPSGVLSPSAACNPSPQSHHHNRGPKPSSYTPLTEKALATAFSYAAGPSNCLAEAADGKSPDLPHARKSSFDQPIEATNSSNTTSAAQKSHHRSHRPMPSSASTQCLRDAQNSLPCSDASALPPRLPIMSSGLGIVEGRINETQDQKLHKKRGALGDFFRRRDQGISTMDDIVHGKDRGNSIMDDDMVHVLDSCGV